MSTSEGRIMTDRFGKSRYRRAIADGSALLGVEHGAAPLFSAAGNQPGRKYGRKVRSAPRRDRSTPTPMSTAARIAAYGGLGKLTPRQRRRVAKKDHVLLKRTGVYDRLATAAGVSSARIAGVMRADRQGR